MASCVGDNCSVDSKQASADASTLQPAAKTAGDSSVSKNDKQSLKIKIVSDTIWPWCYVGKRRLEDALKRVDHSQVDVQIEWSPFFLDPSLPEQSVSKMERYAQKFGEQRIKAMIPHMKEVGKQHGIDFSYGGKVGNTMLSHILVEEARAQGKENEMIDVLFRLYFEKEGDVADKATLVKAAEEAGVRNAEKVLNNRTHEDEVWKKVKGAYAQGVSGVPYFIIQDKYGISGAQEARNFEAIFRRIGIPAAPADKL